jgi:ABC-type transporter Mla subunit MlaD
MSEESRRFRLGVFVISGAALAVSGVIALGAGRLFQKTDPLYCYFQENVQGLERGSSVKFRGVEVGRVDRINVMPEGRIAAAADTPHTVSLIEVVSSLDVDKISDQEGGMVDREQLRASIARRVSQGLRVQIAWKDITGQKYLDLDFVDPAQSPPPPLPFTPPGAYIPAAVTASFTDIQRDVATVAQRLAEVDFKAMSEEARGLVASLRKQSEALDAAKFGEAADAIRDLARNPKIDDALTRLDSTLDHVGRAASRLDDLLARPTMGAAIDDLAASAASLRRLSAQLETEVPKTTAAIDDTLASARRALDDSKLPETTAAARDVMSDVGVAARQLGAMRDSAQHTITEIGQASRTLTALVRYLEENPDALLHGKSEAVR